MESLQPGHILVYKTMKSLDGYLLVASPALVDPNFAKTVVLMIQHNEEGAFGLVLNRPTSKSVKDLWKEVSQSPCDSQQPVHLGGPVSGPLMSIHANEAMEEIGILPGVFFSAKGPSLDELVRQCEHAYKIFVGHAGWSPGQLESEIEAGGWLTTPAKAEYVFYDGEDLWEKVNGSIRASTLQEMLSIKHVPEDPSMN